MLLENRYKIIGFTNPMILFPAFVVIVSVENDNYFITYPSRKTFQTDEISSISDLERRPVFWKDTKERDFDIMTEIAFAFSKENVIVGSKEIIKRQIKIELETKVLPERDLKLLQKWLKSLENEK